MTEVYTAFAGHRRLASGSLHDIALAVKRAADSGSQEPILAYDEAGRLVDIDVRGSDEARLAPAPEPVPDGAQRGRGRPKLGVVAREVTLLPRHWDWLATQPGGASVALRKIVETAARSSVDGDRERRRREAAYHFMSSIAGDFPGFEEAARAVFAGDGARLRSLLAGWPPDIRDHALVLAGQSDAAGA